MDTAIKEYIQQNSEEYDSEKHEHLFNEEELKTLSMSLQEE